MNLLCCCSKDYAEEIIKQIRADNYYFISVDYTENLSNVFSYVYKPFHKGKFFSKYNWKGVPPLNRKIIEDMMLYEPEILKMYERVGKQYTLYNKRKIDYLNNLRYWNHFLDKNNITSYFRYYGPPHEGFDYIIYCLCKIKGIPTYSSCFGVAPDFYYISEDVKNPLPKFQDIYETNKQVYLDNEVKIELMPILQETIDAYWNKKQLTYPPVVVPKSNINIQNKRIKQYEKVLEYYNSNCHKPSFADKYIYFPLQYQYEATSTPMAGVFNNQYLIVEILSRCGIPIYLKEHPRMSGNRSIDFFKKMRLPNVYFMPIEYDSSKLIDNAFTVVGMAGTGGWEAIIKTKPVLMFGYTFYQYYDNVHRIDGVNDLIEKMKNFRSSTQREILIFLKTLEGFLFKESPQNTVSALKNKILGG